ncbi:ABC transporter substrate-binding protein [Halomontanus rarus]|uniref:ABC transporter substrate-binding protein n=1 Tax=Halomontanus rarus TaxID=3034020 RepID=UPI0023E770C5|nr:ABC transporter substrate-binding protein [Halovivax sp. TS33]
MGSDPTQDTQLTVRNVPRRKWLGMLGAASAAAMAGCTGDDDSGNGNGNGGNGNNSGNGNGNGGNGNGNGNGGEQFFADRQFIKPWTSYPPTDMQFNGAAPNQNMFFGGTNYRDWGYAQLAVINNVTQELWLLFLNDLQWNLEADTPNVEITILEGWTWWPSGNEVTVEDIASRFRLGKYGVAQMDDVSDSVASLELVDDYTLRFNLKTADINKRSWTTNLATYVIVEHTRYEEHLQSLAEADGRGSIEEIDQTYGEEISDQEAVDEVRQQIQDLSIDEPYGNMPMQLAERNEQEFIWELNQDHAGADAFNFGGVYMEFMGNDAATQAFIQRRSDHAGNLPRQYQGGDNVPDHATEILFPAGVGPWALFNMAEEPTNDIHFRRAVMHLVERDQLGEALGFRWDPIEIPCGMDAGQPENWLSNPDSFNTYEPDQEAAAAELEAGGWQQDGDEWVDENGEPLELTIKTNGGNTPWTTTADFIHNRLSEFGIASDFITEEGSTFLGNSLPNRDYHIGVRFAGGWSTYPYGAFDGDLTSSRAKDEYAMPDSIEVPPVGEFDAEPSEEIVFADLVQEVGQTADEERVNELFEQLAWAWNWYIPIGPMTSQMGVQYFNTARFEVPENPEDIPGGAPQVGALAMKDALHAIEE